MACVHISVLFPDAFISERSTSFLSLAASSNNHDGVISVALFACNQSDGGGGVTHQPGN